MFVEPEVRESADYAEFWARLNRGEFTQAEYKRIGKNGKEVWIKGSYNPILDLNGRPYKVINMLRTLPKRYKAEGKSAECLAYSRIRRTPLSSRIWMELSWPPMALSSVSMVGRARNSSADRSKSSSPTIGTTRPTSCFVAAGPAKKFATWRECASHVTVANFPR